MACILLIVVVAMSLTPDQTPNRHYDAVALIILVAAYASVALLASRPFIAVIVTMAFCGLWINRNYLGALPAPALLIAVYLVAVGGLADDDEIGVVFDEGTQSGAYE